MGRQEYRNMEREGVWEGKREGGTVKAQNEVGNTNEFSTLILQEKRKLSERGVSIEKEEEEIVPISQSDDIHDIVKERGVRDRDNKLQ